MSVTSLMNQSLTITPRGGIDGFGENEDGTPFIVKARVEPEVENVIDSVGQTRITNFRIFIEPTVTITPQDKVTWDGTTYLVLKVESMYKGSGELSHKEVMV